MRLTKRSLSVVAVALMGVAAGWLLAGDFGVLERAPTLASPGAALPITAPSRAETSGGNNRLPAEGLNFRPLPAPQTPGQQLAGDGYSQATRPASEAMLEAYREPGWLPPPWTAGYEGGPVPHRNFRGPMYPWRGDPSHGRHRSLLDSFCPWSKAEQARDSRNGYGWPTSWPDARGYPDAVSGSPPIDYPGSWGR